MPDRVRIWLLALICCGLAVAVTEGGSTIARAQTAGAKGLPGNYRQLIAQYITATYIVPRLRYPIRGAKISQPHARPGGLFSSSVVPAVCVILYRDNPFGQVVDENWVVTIESGRVRQLPTIDVASCPGYSTFHELLRRRDGAPAR
jgi:hypothetical protein